jgi:colanic acid/amylovoran biosynthesis glycosyltransferase
VRHRRQVPHAAPLRLLRAHDPAPAAGPGTLALRTDRLERGARRAARQQGWAARYPELFAAVDLVLCEGPHMLECVQRLGCPRDKLRLHRLGVDLGAIPFRPRVLQPGEPLRVLLAAAFREKKGLPYGIRALGLLRSKVPLRVTVIGGAGDSDESRAEAAAIGQAVKEAGLADCIRMLGFQSHVRLHAEAADHHVLLQPSVTARNGDTEGGAPVSLIEMAASGMAIVSTRHCDIPDIVEDGVTGLLAEERDVQGLADCLQRLCAEPSRWPAMLAAGRARMQERHDAAKQAAALWGHYRSLVPLSAPGAGAANAPRAARSERG